MQHDLVASSGHVPVQTLILNFLNCNLIVYHVLCAGIAEVYKLESNQNLRLTLDSMQMPIVEYKEINMDDYSMFHVPELHLH